MFRDGIREQEADSSTDDLQIGQRLLELLHSGIGHLGTDKIEAP